MKERVLEWCDTNPVLCKLYLSLLGIICLYHVGYMIGKLVYHIIH